VGMDCLCILHPDFATFIILLPLDGLLYTHTLLWRIRD